MPTLAHDDLAPAAKKRGPKTAAILVAKANIPLAPTHDRLASYCGIAPAGSQPGASVHSTRSQQDDNKALKNLLIFFFSSPASTKQVRETLQ